jgi:membrane-associated PAP2 superfamily phosphatase
MKQRETRGLAVTGCFLAVLLALIAAGMSPIEAGVAPVDSAELERYGADAQFLQYLEYRVALENSSHCQ